MAIGCTINETQFLYAYDYINSAIKAKLDAGNIFDASEFMRYFYNTVKDSQLAGGLSNQAASERAAEWLAETPSIIDQVISRNYINNLSQLKNIAELHQRRYEFNKEDISLADIAKYFEKANRDAQVAAQNRKNTNGGTRLSPKTDYKGKTRLSSRTILSTTLPIFKAKKKDELVAPIDQERVLINKTLGKIIGIASGISATKVFKYQGSELMLMAVNAAEFTNSTTEEGLRNSGKLDSTTQEEFARSREMIQQGKAKDTVTQITERVLLIVTDENGNPISFDKDGNITAKADGKYVFQFLRDARKRNGEIELRDIYGREQRVDIDAAVQARAQADTSKTLAQHLKDVNNELEFYYALKNYVNETDTVLLDIVGLTEGLDKGMGTQEIAIEEVIKAGMISEDNLSDGFKVNDKEADFGEGVTEIYIKGKGYAVERKRVSEDIANQITAVLFDAKFSAKRKEKFYSQFLPENSKKFLGAAYRRHRLTLIPAKKESDNAIALEIYSKVGLKDENLTHTFKFTSEGTFERVGDEYVQLEDLDFETAEQVFKDALLKAYVPPSSKPTFMSYDKDLLAAPESFEVYDFEKGRTVLGNYHDFMMDAMVKFTPQTNGALNQQIIFRLPTDVSKFLKSEDQDPVNTEAAERETFLKAEKARIEQELSELGEGTTKQDKIMLKIEKGSLERELKVLNSELNTPPLAIPAELQDLIVPTTVFGKQQTIINSTAVDREIVAVSIDGKRYMFYRSSAGTSGKVAGEWYPFYGMDTTGWVVKDGFKPGTTEWQYNGQASAELQVKLEEAGNRLNEVYGPGKIENFSIPFIDTTIEEINTIIGSPIKEGVNFDNRASDTKVAEELQALRKQVAEEGFIPGRQVGSVDTSIENTPENNEANINNEIDKGPDSEQGGFQSGEGLSDDDILDFDRSGKLKNDKVSAEEIAAAEKWWKTSGLGKTLQKHISLNQAANIVNSDAYANFVVNMARLGNPNMLGTINLNTKGTMVDLYHEAFHGFTQLFLTVAQKKALYTEVMNYTDAKGNKPYLLKSAREIEELLAEDFRTYMKNQNVKKGAPVRNTFFRRMLNYIKAFFNRLRGKQPKPPSIKEVTVDMMSIPAVKELYENLRMGSPEFLNKYQASIDNARFFYLERGSLFVDKLGNDKNRRQALSAQDSKLVSEAMDSIISDLVDIIYKRQVGLQPKLPQLIEDQEKLITTLEGEEKEKGLEKLRQLQAAINTPGDLKKLSLQMLLDVNMRSKLYALVKGELVKRNAEIAKDWAKSTDNGEFMLNAKPKENETEIEALKRKAVVVLEKKDGRKKYVLLRSQIDSFDQLNPNLKEERVKGEKYYDISITGDYFIHKTLRNPEGERGFAEIIVVSDVADAKKQYDNYKKMGAQYETIAVDQWANIFEKIENRKPKNLTAAQEAIFDNLRILSTTIDQFGDPTYLKKKIAPRGMIAYHIMNSDFEIGRKKYFVAESKDEDKGELLDEKDQTIDDILTLDGTLESIDPELFDNKKSILELADKEVVYILKSLHELKLDKNGQPQRYKSGPNKGEFIYASNQLGFKRRADFRKTWNVVSKTITGVQDRATAFDLLKEEAKVYPELNQLIESKLPDPRKIKTNTFAMSISGSFFKTFSRPKSGFKELLIMPQVDENGEPLAPIFTVTDATADIRKVMLQFQSYFKMGLSRYVKLSDKGTASVDTVNLLEDLDGYYEAGGSTLKVTKDFLFALGIRLDDTKLINDQIITAQFQKQVSELKRFAEEIAALKQDKSITKDQKRLVRSFEADPVGIIKNKTNRVKIELLPSYNSQANLRIDSALKYITEIQSKFGFDTPGQTLKLPDGNKAYSVINHMSATSLLDALNNVNTLEDNWTDGQYKDYMGHMKPTKNFFTQRSKLLDSIYAKSKDGVRKRIGKLDLIAIAGSKVFDEATGIEEGLNTADLTELDKFFQEFNIVLTSGISEFVRHSEKKLAYAIMPTKKSIVMTPDGLVSKSANSKLWIDIEKFDSEDGQKIALEGFLLDYIATEFDRIRFFAENPDVLKTTEGFNKPLVSTEGKTRAKIAENVKKDFETGNLSGQNFTLTDDLLSEKSQKKLKTLANSLEFKGDVVEYIRNTPELYEDIRKSIINYFQDRTDSMMNNFVSKVDSIKANETIFNFLNDDYTGNRSIDSVVKAYLYNDWISKFEAFNLLNGDAAQFDHAKENATKRISGSTSNGDTFMYDQYAQAFMSDPTGFNSSTYSSIEFDKKLTFDGHLNTVVIDDPLRLSIYLSDMQAAWRADYIRNFALKNKVLTEEDLDKLIAKDSAPYQAMQEADGAAYLTLDAYRMLKYLGNEWSEAQEDLYQDVINPNVEVDSTKVNEFFPVYKLHYYGPVTNAEIATTAMYKFAVAPIIPSVATSGTGMYDLQAKMIKDNTHMTVFSSGSKAGFLTEEVGNIDNLFVEDSNFDFKKINQDAKLRNNRLHVRYLKDVTKVSTELKNYITLGTQDRVINISTLFDMGKYKSKAKAILGKEYQEAVDNLTDIYKEEFLDKVGFTFDKESGKYKGNLVKLIEVIREDLELKGISEQLIAMLDVNLSDHLKHDFSIIPVSDVVESIIVNKITKAIVNQKTKGESDVQVPSTFYEGLWDQMQYEGDKVTKQQKSLVKTLSLQRQYLSTNNLKFYERGAPILGKDGKQLKDENGELRFQETALAHVAKALNGDFLNLLNIEDPEFKGQTIRETGGRQRLNVLIKQDDFRNEHIEKLTIAGPRIPTDAINLKEAFEIWHFTDASLGNTVIVPTEIVAKAGSDFDVDKLFFSFPNIEKDGSLTQAVPNFKKKREALRAKGQSVSSRLIQQQKRFSQNEWIRTSVGIIKDMSNYGALTKPTSDYHLKDEVERFYGKLATVYNPLDQNTNSTRKSMSPTRIMEAEYNLNKHKELLGGNRPLGILAKAVKQYELYKSIGAKFPLKYFFTPNERNLLGRFNSDIERDFVLNFDHNTTSKGNISLGSELNVDGEQIGDILSHYLQAILDRANDSFASKANITKEALPVLIRLIQSGVSKEAAVAFVNQPLIADYLIRKAEASGFVKKSLGAGTEASIFAAISEDMEFSKELKEELRGAYRYSNKKRVEEIVKNLKKNYKNTQVRITYNEQTSGNKREKVIKVYKDINSIPSYMMPEYFSKIEVKLPARIGLVEQFEEIFISNFVSNEGPVNLSPLKYQHYYISEYFNKSKEFKGKKLEDNISSKSKNTEEQLGLLAHFFQIESQSMGMVELEQAFNPDTAGLDTLVGVLTRKARIDKLYSNSKVDQETLDKLIKDSVISSTYVTQIYQDIAEPLFQLRLNKKITNYITESLINDKAIIVKKFGYRERELGRYINSFNNTLVDFIYQNTKSNFTDENQLPVELPQTIGDRTVEKFKGTLMEPIQITDSTIKVDMNSLKTLWGGGSKFKKQRPYLTNAKDDYALSFGARGLDTFSPDENPFKTLDSFVRYMVQKEVLYTEYNKQDFDSNKAYEQFISKKALVDTYNSAYIRGTTKYSYTRDVLNIIKNNQDLLNNYPVLRQFGESFMGRSVLDEENQGGLSLLELKDKNIIDSTTAGVYFKNIKDLGNIDITKKSTGKNANTSNEISAVFKNFSMMMFYQQGVGRSSISFSNILDGEEFGRFMNASVNTFMEKMFTSKNEDNLKMLLDYVKQAVLTARGFKMYNETYEMFLGKNMEGATLLPTDTGVKTLDTLAEKYNAEKIKGNISAAMNFFVERAKLQAELKQQSELDAKEGENISSKGSDFAKKLTNIGNNLTVTYKGTEFRNAEHAYQTYKSGEFDQQAYESTSFKPKASKSANRAANFGIMTDIIAAKLKQHPELVTGIDKRGGLAYLKKSTHDVIGDTYWESKGENKFIEALISAYKQVKSTEETSSIKVSAVIQDMYDKWSDEIKSKIGMTTEELQTEFNNTAVRLGADETQYMNTKWNNCKG